MKKTCFPILVFILMTLNSCDSKERFTSEIRVKERVIKYLNLFFNGHYQEAWEMLSQVVKTPFKWTKDRWVGQWRKNPPKEKLVSIRFKNIKIVQKEGHFIAYVYMFLKFKFFNNNGKEIIEEREVPDLWGFENNDWYRFEQD